LLLGGKRRTKKPGADAFEAGGTETTPKALRHPARLP
jgi:hypothetical protein